ncbi:FecR family protein [Pedobacter deserti]|uniref:FecR family protein n=1 Tax=Pedobacter deserti TaxID=2817382 RepID=UPI00210E95D5|nr:FecR family protein [Pedobacter sp. SYSU D00382]
MTKQELDSLIDKVHNGTANDEELGLYNHYMNRIALGSSNAFGVAAWNTTELGAEDDVKQELYDRIEKIRLVRISRQLTLWPRFAIIAAAAVAAIIIGVWFFNYHHLDDRKDLTNITKNDIAPGKHGATITLANGKVITLSEAKSGVVIGGAEGLVYNDNTAVISGEDGEILKKGLYKGSSASTGMTAVTQKGQTYQFTLPDGTKVWLNADSKISFPSQFNGKERKVLLEGEGYFEVVHNAKQPFRVESTSSDGKKQVVEDIGTAFNISAYGNDQVTTTTLVEGEARVSAFDARSGIQSAVLKPNQQAIQNARGGMQVRRVDPEQAVSWKEGVFIYNSTPLEDVMRQVARWYNVEVVYEHAGLKKKLFGGSALRSDHVSKILQTIENTGAVHFKIEGRRITVMK